ncbi:hypothetical protein TMatcc_004307 [Talaromyces marneffei ATCC 18224]|uniref:Uncharacterized protein n=2 Tax=Talaromyces marneffei TaxID=37727 RepID=B6Q5D0_TALMQ|nr:uncharacterized protein EYB26_000735 [Talaromyces marneffei]EEA27405.1 conserved hypothetical protein [Talaromyces marneffei ATCC 18224]KAE8556893.1 hypothetical protein EYB25_001599 [Talaromyces marneffei]QGA13090.1 hypothetical protein EYB26_000735 [Talaromyces marneffei]
MLSSLFLMAFFAAVATANRLAGMYQALFFYQVYRLDVDANGLENCHMAPSCRLNNDVCDLETFMRKVSLVKPKPLFFNGEPVIDPATNRQFDFNDPDFDQVNWDLVGEGDDLGIFTTEMQKSDFKGDIKNDVLFKDWGGQNSFDGVMSKAEEITKNAISKLNVDGREPAQGVINRMLAAIQTHATARQIDLMKSLTSELTLFLQLNGFSAVLTDPIEKPPIATYQELDIDGTIRENQGKTGFNTEFELTLRTFIINKVKATGRPKTHLNTVLKALSVYKNLAEVCNAT